MDLNVIYPLYIAMAAASYSTRLSAQACRPLLHAIHSSRAPPLFVAITSRVPPSRQRRSFSSTGTDRFYGPRRDSVQHLTYHVAASYTAKNKVYDPATHIFHFNPYHHVQPPSKRSKRARPKSGQDAFFVTRLNDTGGIALGVADGVGGWMDSGVDPADFSHGFCDHTACAAYASPGEKSSSSITARSLMQTGYEAICADPAVPAGGSTALVGLFAPDGSLEVANLGDSGYILLRLGGVYAHSEPQTHAFNTPYQLSVIPPATLHRMQCFGGTKLADLPHDAEVSRHSLRHGDVLVFATDGLWDNLFNQDVLQIVSAAMRRRGAWLRGDAGGLVVRPDLSSATATEVAERSLQGLIATEITGAAKTASEDAYWDGPFSKEVRKQNFNRMWQGGKVDDICVVAVVVSAEKPDEAPIKGKL